MIRPKDVRTDLGHRSFMGSGLKNYEAELVAWNIVLQQQQRDPEHWTPFTWEDYVSYCEHTPTPEEKAIIYALADGGQPVWNSSARFSGGHLAQTDEGFIITPLFIADLPTKVKPAAA